MLNIGVSLSCVCVTDLCTCYSAVDCRRPHRHRRTGPSLFVIIGIIVGVVSFVALAVLCYKRRKVVFSSRKNASNSKLSSE